MKKVLSINEGLNEIEKIDLSIADFLDKDKYAPILELMKQRLTVISEITRLKNERGIDDSDKLRLEQIFSGANNVMQKIQTKQTGINERLEKRKKIDLQNKKIGYK